MFTLNIKPSLISRIEVEGQATIIVVPIINIYDYASL